MEMDGRPQRRFGAPHTGHMIDMRVGEQDVLDRAAADVRRYSRSMSTSSPGSIGPQACRVDSQPSTKPFL